MTSTPIEADALSPAEYATELPVHPRFPLHRGPLLSEGNFSPQHQAGDSARSAGLE